MFVNFRSFPPSSGMLVIAVLSDRSVHYSPCLADHKTARDVFSMVLSNGGIVEAAWIDPTRGEPVEIAAYCQCGLTNPGGLIEKYQADCDARDARREAAADAREEEAAALRRSAREKELEEIAAAERECIADYDNGPGYRAAQA